MMSSNPPAQRLFAVSLLAAFLIVVLSGSAASALAATPIAAQEPEHAASPETQEPTVPQEGEEHAVDDQHAEEGEHAAAEPKPWYHWPAKWINFIMLVGLLYWMLVIPPKAVQDIFSFAGLQTIFVQRSAGIIEARNLAAAQKTEAAEMLSESEQRLAKIAEEVAALVSDARLDAERETSRSLDDSKAQAEKVLEVARREVKQERVTAQRHLRGFVADLAVSLAEKNLAEHLTPDDQDRLIREYLSRLGQSMA